MNRDKPKESDWKQFRAMVPELRERYLCRKNKELAAIFADEKLTPTERFWKVEERIREEARILRDCLDNHSRSRMVMSIALMYRHGMLDKEELEAFSDEIAERIKVVSEI